MLPPVERRRRGVAALVESKKSLSAPEWAAELTLFLLKYLIRTEPKTFRRPLPVQTHYPPFHNAVAPSYIPLTARRARHVVAGA